MSILDGPYQFFSTRPPPRQRNGRPNFNQIHAKSLPLDVYPLPTLIPHNPLSVLLITFTYIFQLLIQPSSHPNPRIRGYFSYATSSVHVTEPPSISQLWQYGFFGKGSLSRSEPTWLDREKKRLGNSKADTSEEYTASRRDERRRFKNERARKEREAIDERLMEELLVDKIARSHKSLESLAGSEHGEEKRKPGKPTLRSKYEGLAEAVLLSPTKGIGFLGGERMLLPTPPVTPSPEPTQKAPESMQPSEFVANGNVEAPSQIVKPELAPEEIESQEHLQLTPEEAFFLTYALGILEIYPEPCPSPNNVSPTAISTTAHPITPTSLLTFLTATSPQNPSHPFLLNYTTYHHFRAHGWVVRPGLKFGVDYLLYLRGPVFSHAEFAVVIQPAYRHPFWKTHEGWKLRWRANTKSEGIGGRKKDDGDDKGYDREGDEDEQQQRQRHRQRSWHWLHCLQRVQSQVRKTLVVAWVDVPPPPVPLMMQRVEGGGQEAEVDISAMLQRYKIREMVLKRWIPNRSRD